MTRTKVLLFASSLHGGGGERVMAELSRAFMRHGVADTVIATLSSEVSFASGGRHVSLGVSGGRLRRTLQGFRGFRRLLRVEKPDWVAAVDTLPNVLSVLLARRAVLRLDNSLSHGRSRLGLVAHRFLLRLLCRRAAALVAVSEGLRQESIRLLGPAAERMTVIYNPVDIMRIRELAKAEIDPDDHEWLRGRPFVVGLGRLVEQKAHTELIESFGVAVRRNLLSSDATLLIVGEGGLRERLQATIAEHGLQARVRIVPWRTNPYPYLREARTFVSSSAWEGLGIAIIEALAVGCPVVSTDCAWGPREILAPGTGWQPSATAAETVEFGLLVPAPPHSHTRAALADAISRVWNDHALADDLRQRGQRRAADFDVTLVPSQYAFLGVS